LTIAELALNDNSPTKRCTALRRLSSGSPPPRSDTFRVILSIDENSIVSELNATVQANPHVSFGSYPLVDHPEYKTIITLEGRFYNGGYTKGSERFLRSLSDVSAVAENQSMDVSDNESTRQSLYFSKEEMNNNIKIALEDLKSRLPPESIIKVDSHDDLAVDRT
jgi:hypothetical protein